MISKRFFTLFLLLVSFGIFVAAKPVDNYNVAIRELRDVTKNNVDGLARRHYSENPRDSTTVYSTLSDLQDQCDPLIGQLDGSGDLLSIVAELVADINAAAAIIVDLQITDCVNISACVTIIVSLILNICAGVLLYPANSVRVQALAQLNTCITAWVQIIINLCPSIVSGLVLGLLGHLLTLLLCLPGLVTLLGL